MRRVVVRGRCLVGLLCLAVAVASHAQLLITEFMALNNATLVDQDGQFSDWIELYNAGPETVSVGGWYLTDDANALTKWRFPATEVPAGGYLVVFASGKNRAVAGGELHTSFSLSGNGEYLGLVRPDGATVAFEYAPEFPPQRADVSYGIDEQTGAKLFLSPPTPGWSNDLSAGLAAPARFSLAGGVFRE